MWCGRKGKEYDSIELDLGWIVKVVKCVIYIYIYFTVSNLCFFFRPKGYPCSTNPCTEAALCTGDNPFCPISNKHKVNGTVCPEGVCFMGKCKQATICVGDCCDAENIAKVFIFFLFIIFRLMVLLALLVNASMVVARPSLLASAIAVMVIRLRYSFFYYYYFFYYRSSFY